MLPKFTPTAHHKEGPVLVATCSLAGDKCTTSTQLTTRVWCLKRSPLAGNSHQGNPGSWWDCSARKQRFVGWQRQLSTWDYDIVSIRAAHQMGRQPHLMSFRRSCAP